MTRVTAAEALFASFLQPSDDFTAQQLRTGINSALVRCGGECGCAEVCAAEYGEHPEAAAARMRWALATVAGAKLAAV